MIRLTPAAVERIRALRAAHGLGPEVGLRVLVRSGAAGAERFALELDQGPGARDRSWQVQGLTVFCDPRTYLYLGDLEIDWREDRGGFWIRECPRFRAG